MDGLDARLDGDLWFTPSEGTLVRSLFFLVGDLLEVPSSLASLAPEAQIANHEGECLGVSVGFVALQHKSPRYAINLKCAGWTDGKKLHRRGMM